MEIRDGQESDPLTFLPYAWHSGLMDWNPDLPAEFRTHFFDAFRDNLDLVLDILHSMDVESREAEEINAAEFLSSIAGALACFATTYEPAVQRRNQATQ